MIEIRGLLYKKIKKLLEEKREEVKELPIFKIKKIEDVVEIKRGEDITKVNVNYPLIEPFAYANIKYDENLKILIYNVIEPELTKEEKEILKRIINTINEIFVLEEDKDVLKTLEETFKFVIKELKIKLSSSQYLKLFYYVYRDFIGLNELEPLMNDVLIEDISCDGAGIPIFVVHKVYGSLRTNIIFNDESYLRNLVIKLAQRAGRYISYAEPILDATLPDGSRIAATLSKDVATRGSTFTIRKFREVPFSPIELILNNTCNEEVFAYLWILLQFKISILIIGGTGSGKTSFLNSISFFIPPEAKIVSIEDTREIKLLHEHWVPTLARLGFGLPGISGQKYGEVTLFDLLKESFRMNPDYLIVGETRGPETYVMFQGMASGHAALSTFHATSLDSLVTRLTSPPINLSPTLLESLGTIVIMTHAKEKGAAARRVREIVEIVGVDYRTGEVNSNIVFRWDPSTDTFERVNESILIKKIASLIGITEEKLKEEYSNRVNFLKKLKEAGIKDYKSFYLQITSYYKGLTKLEIKKKKILPERKYRSIFSILKVFEK